MNTDTETKPLTKQTGHIATACKAIQKQIDKYNEQIGVQKDKALAAENRINALREEVQGLQEQIKKLKGE